MDVKVTWKQEMAFTGTAESGHELTLDSSEDSGGHNTGFRPMELMALGTAGCTSMDVLSILSKKKYLLLLTSVKFTWRACRISIRMCLN